MYQKINDDQYIVYLQESFFTVNRYTLDLILVYEESESMAVLSQRLNCSEDEVKKIYENLNLSFESSEYNEELDDFSGPLHVKWKLTSKCNIRCKHCYIGDKSNQQLSKEENLLIARKIADSGAFIVTISGGEPLIVEELAEIIELLVSNGLYIHIFTNGIKIPQFLHKLSLLRDLPYQGYVQFKVSLDGMEKTHDAVRGRGTFDMTIDGIKQAIKNNYAVFINTTVNSVNMRDVIPLVKLCENLGVAGSQLSNLINRGWAKDNQELLQMTNEDHIQFEKGLKELTKAMGKDFSIIYSPLQKSESVDIPSVYQFKEGQKVYVGKDTWQCGAGKGKCVINETGNILCCPFFSSSKIGHILNQDFNEIWENPKRKQFIEHLKNINGTNRYCAVMKGDCDV